MYLIRSACQYERNSRYCGLHKVLCEPFSICYEEMHATLFIVWYKEMKLIMFMVETIK